MTTRLVFFGSGSFGLPSLDALRRTNLVEIVAVISQPDRLQGRAMKSEPTATSAWAVANQLPLFRPERIKNNLSLATEIRNLKPDMALVADFGMILPAEWLKIFPRGNINLHASLLPKYRGAAPIQTAILNGEPQSGVSFMLMDEGIDTGGVLASFPIPIGDSMTAPHLYADLAAAAARHAADILSAWLLNQISPQLQDSSQATLTKRIVRDDGHVRWDKAEIVCRQIRAYDPWPGAWTTWKGNALKILQATYQTASPMISLGTVSWMKPPQIWGIACADGWLIPQQIHFSGRKPQAAATVPGSYPDWIGAQLV